LVLETDHLRNICCGRMFLLA